VTLESIIAVLSTTCGLLPEPRCPARVNESLHDTRRRGFALRFLQPPSLWALQRQRPQRRGRGNWETLCDVHAVPSETQRRAMVDGVPVALLHQAGPKVGAKVRRAGGAKDEKSTGPSGAQQGAYDTARLAGRDALHATTSACPGWWPRPEAHGEVPVRPTGVSAPRVKAGAHRGWPRDGAAVRTSDGQAKPEGEGQAAQRLRPRLRQAPPQRPRLVGGAERSGHEPCSAP
jgi:hypothetical protein